MWRLDRLIRGTTYHAAQQVSHLTQNGHRRSMQNAGSHKIHWVVPRSELGWHEHCCDY
jgi:hypothetical protein